MNQLEIHNQAQQLAADAEELLRRSEVPRARRLYSEAASLESQAFDLLSPTAVRTRGIFAVSAVSLYYKAGDYARAERLALRILDTGDLPEFALDQVQETLQIVWEEKKLAASGRQIGPQSVMVALRGSDVGTGKAPLGLVVDKALAVNALLYRITEAIGKFPFRVRGAPPDAVRQICQPWVGEPQAGSYRFGISLVQPLQMSLFTDTQVTPNQISEYLIRIVRSISPTTISPGEDLLEVLPDESYRQAILKLVRNLTPDGNHVNEIEFATEGGPSVERAYLHRGARDRIRGWLEARSDDDRESSELRGILRALDLDKTWVSVHPEKGEPVRCRIPQDSLDDVIGPMVNRHVIARGRWNRRKRLILTDIELDPDAPSV